MFGHSAVIHFIVVVNRSLVVLLISARNLLQQVMFRLQTQRMDMVDLDECNDGKMLTDVLDEIEKAERWKLYSFDTSWEYSGSCFYLSAYPSIAGYVWSFIVVSILSIFAMRTFLFVKNDYFDFRYGGYIIFTIRLRRRPFSTMFAIAAFIILVFLFVLTLCMEVIMLGFSRMCENLIETTIPFLVTAWTLRADMSPSEYSKLMDFERAEFKDRKFKRDPFSMLFETNESFCLKLILKDLDEGKHLQKMLETQESNIELECESESDKDE